jgi:hypothetical protein
MVQNNEKNEYYVFKELMTPWRLDSRDKYGATLIEANSQTKLFIAPDELSRRLRKKYIEPAAYLLAFSYTKDSQVTPKNILIAFSGIKSLVNRMKEPIILDQQSATFHHFELTETKTNKVVFTGKSMDELQQAATQIRLQQEPKKIFNPSAINMQMILEKLGFKNSHDKEQTQNKGLKR